MGIRMFCFVNSKNNTLLPINNMSDCWWYLVWFVFKLKAFHKKLQILFCVLEKYSSMISSYIAVQWELEQGLSISTFNQTHTKPHTQHQTKHTTNLSTIIQITSTKEHTGSTVHKIPLLTHKMGNKPRSYKAPLALGPMEPSSRNQQGQAPRQIFHGNRINRPKILWLALMKAKQDVFVQVKWHVNRATSCASFFNKTCMWNLKEVHTWSKSALASAGSGKGKKS